MISTLIRSALAASLIAFCASAGATPACPSSHFEPLFRFGWMYGDTDPLLMADVAKGKDEDYFFQYIEFQAYSQRDPGYRPVFLVSLLKSDAELWRAVLVRQRDNIKTPTEIKGSVDVQNRPIDAERAKALVQLAATALSRTRYPEPCEIAWVDGYGAQVAVTEDGDVAKGHSVSRDMAGEAFAPPQGSEADAIVQLSRTLHAYVLGKADAAKLDASLTKAKGVIPPD